MDDVAIANYCLPQRDRGQQRLVSLFDIDEDDEADLDGVGATETIVPPPWLHEQCSILQVP